MKFRSWFFKLIISLSASFYLAGCTDDAASRIKGEGYHIKTTKSAFPRGEFFKLQLSEPVADSVFVEAAEEVEFLPGDNTIRLRFQTTGTRMIKAQVYKDGQKSVASKRISIFASSEPVQWPFQVTESITHNPDAYTQGLEFSDGKLFESRGQYGQSMVQRFGSSLASPEKSYTLPSDIFSEGLTVSENEVYQLTWREQKTMVYDRDLNLLRELKFPLNEGWGICSHQKTLWVSDGSNRLYQFDREMRLLDIREVYAGREALNELNELEFVNGKIWANVYRTNRIYRIDPQTGEADAFLDLATLRKTLSNPAAEVLNGIAWHPDRQQFLVTGKYWDKAFWIETGPQPVPET